jgi:hypothetical protein
VIAVLLVIGVEALRRQTAREFPEARLAEGEGLREAWGRLRTSMSERIAEARPGSEARRAAPVTPESTQLEQLERLGSLRDRGILTDAEFQHQKAQILGA